MSWILEEAAVADQAKDLAILEKPDARRYLDRLLLDRFCPAIWKYLAETTYEAAPSKPEITTMLSHVLVRSVSFLMFDHLSFPFFLGEFQCQMDGWMLDYTFSLGLPQDTDPAWLFAILSERRFRGMPPKMEIQESVAHPEWDIHYIVTLQAGIGSSWGPGHSEEYAMQTIKKVIKTSEKMCDISMMDGFSSLEDVKGFIENACAAYEAS
jgi:hypothetical protein